MGRMTYNGKGYYTGVTTEGTRLYVAVERMQESVDHALSNNIDLNFILEADAWVFSLPMLKVNKLGFREEIIRRIWGDRIDEEEDWTPEYTDGTEGVFVGDEPVGLGLFEVLEMADDALLDTSEHRYILHVTYIAHKPAISVKVYTPLGELVKEHRYSSWPVAYAGLCAHYEDFQAYQDWFVYIPEEISK